MKRFFVSKQLIAFFFFLFAMQLANAQEQASVSNELAFNKFQLGLSFSTDYSDTHYRDIKGFGSSTIGRAYKGKLAYTAGINFTYNLKSWLGLETGLQYANRGDQTGLIYVTTVANPDPIADNRIRVQYNFHYIDIPLQVNFLLGKKKARFFSSIGINTNFLVQTTIKSTLYYNDGVERNRSPYPYDFRKVNVSPTLSFGLDYKIGDRMNLRITPRLSYGLMSIIDKNSNVNVSLYNAGLNIGYYYGF